MLQDVHGFPESNITVLMDDGNHTEPTYENMMNAYKTLVASCQAGDAVFCHYSGHGGKIRDEGNDESKCVCVCLKLACVHAHHDDPQTPHISNVPNFFG
jgi:hypothetical protein